MTKDLAVPVCFNLVETEKIKGYIPERSGDLAAGFDVRNAGPDISLRPFEKVRIPLGFRMMVTQGNWWCDLRPRSSTFTKKDLHCLYGVIDEDYEGQVLFAAQYIPTLNLKKISYYHMKEGTTNNYFSMLKRQYENDVVVIEHGEKIAQMIFLPRYEFKAVVINNEEFDKMAKQRGAERGIGGFGSTGDK